MKTFLYIILLACASPSFAQTSKLSKDTLTQTDGTKYIGTLIKTTINEDNTGEVEFVTEDGQTHHMSSSSIAHMAHAQSPAPDNRIPAADKTVLSSSPKNIESNNEHGINWSDPSIPHKVLVKHRAGIGLTVTGVGLMTAGIGMIAAGASQNGQTTTTSNGFSVTTRANIGAVGVIGVFALIAGLPMMIVGAVKIAKANKLAREGTIHFR
jgi:hypothetical protein